LQAKLQEVLKQVPHVTHILKTAVLEKLSFQGFFELARAKYNLGSSQLCQEQYDMEMQATAVVHGMRAPAIHRAYPCHSDTLLTLVLCRKHQLRPQRPTRTSRPSHSRHPQQHSTAQQPAGVQRRAQAAQWIRTLHLCPRHNPLQDPLTSQHGLGGTTR
jgi:hypothetical protein